MTTLNRSGFLFLCCTFLCGPGVTWAQAAPTNDNFADAPVITGETGTTDGNNFSATAEDGEPDYVNVIDPKAACRSVWYQWTAPADGEYYFNTFGSDFDTILAVYTGTAVNSLTWENDNDDYVDIGPPVVNREQSRLSFPATAETTYHLAVDGYACLEGYIALNWGPASLLPPNDDFALAAPISGETGTAAATSINATPENMEPIHHVNNDHAFSSIWFDWTAPPAGGNFFFDTFGSDFDTILAVYEGTDFTTPLNQLAANDDAGTDTQSRVNFAATGDQTYHIVVDGYLGLQGNVTLNWQNLSAPPNDNFADAAAISGQTGTASGYNFLATWEPDEPSHGDATGPYASIWFAWTAPFSGEAAFDSFGSDFDTTMAAYIGTAVDSLTKLQENDDAGTGTQSRVTFPVVAGSTYYIAVDGFEGADGNVTLNWQNLSAPPNDNFADAAPISGITGTTSAYNFLATAETGEPSHGDATGPSASIWFEWTAPFSGEAAFDTFGSDFDTTMAAYTGTAVDSLTKLQENDDAGTGTQSRVTFPVVVGSTYYIAVDGFEGADGNVTLNWQNLSAPPNDNFADAAPISGQTGTTSAYNFLATWEPDEPWHGDASGPFASIWFAWTAPFSGKAAFDTFGSDFDTTMAAYIGTAVDSLTKLQENDNAGTGFQSRITFPVVAGSTYYIAVDGYDGADGNVVLNWKRHSPWILFLPAVIGTAGP